MFLKANDKSIRYTGRWGEIGENKVTTAPGGMIEIAYSGTAAVMHFDTGFSVQPFPHIWVSVDNGAKVEVPLDHVIRVEAPTDGEHLIKVVYKGAVEMHHRWNGPLIGKLSFEGVDVEKGAQLPADDRKIIEFIGDSITEGVLIDAFYNFDKNNDQYNRPNQDDSTATYAYLTAEALGMKPVIMGYGATGVCGGGCGSVPRVALAYPYNFAGSPAKAQGSEIIVINHGANDRGASAEEYTQRYAEFLELVRKINPDSKIVVLSAFCKAYPKELKATVEEFNRKSGDSVYFIDTDGWIPAEPLHPLRDGHKIVAAHLTEALRKMFSL